MRYLLLTRGMPFCGKSEWIAKHNLHDYTLSLLDFKRLLVAPSLSESGRLFMDFSGCEKAAFAMLFSALESRMSRGEFIVIKDNHISKSYFSNYKEIAKTYNYRILIVDFSDVSLDEIKKRNAYFSELIESKNNNSIKKSNTQNSHSHFLSQSIPTQPPFCKINTKSANANFANAQENEVSLENIKSRFYENTESKNKDSKKLVNTESRFYESNEIDNLDSKNNQTPLENEKNIESNMQNSHSHFLSQSIPTQPPICKINTKSANANFTNAQENIESRFYENTESKNKDSKKLGNMESRFYESNEIDNLDSKNNQTPLENEKSIESKHEKVYTNDELDALYDELKNGEIPIKCDVIAPDEVTKMLTLEPKSLNGYKVIHHIGDIQGSFAVLKKYIQKIKDNEFYIFLGDYIDRGFQNYEVLRFLISIMDKKNVVLLEGNHEKWLNDWANNRDIDSREFRLNTQVELESKGFSKADAKRFYNKLLPFFFYRFHDKRILCTHGGLSNMPQHLILLSANQCIHGVGGYLNTNAVAASFSKNTPKNYYQFFGHRNKSELPIRIHERNFIMESKVEFGGFLRIVQLSQNGFKDCSLRNAIFVSKEQKDSKVAVQKYFDSLEKHNTRVTFSRFKNMALVSYPAKLSSDVIASAFGFSPCVVDEKEWAIVARGMSFSLDFNKKFALDLNSYLDSIKLPLRIYSRTRGIPAFIAYYKGEFFYFLDSILQTQMPLFLQSKSAKKALSELLKKGNFTLHFVLDSKNSFILQDVFCNNSSLPQFELVESVARVLNVAYNECVFMFESLGEYKDFLKTLRAFNADLSKSLDSNLDSIESSFLESNFLESKLPKSTNSIILNEYKFSPLIAFDNVGGFTTLPMCLNSECNALLQMIKIWKLQGEISKLQWINNAFRERFFAWFVPFSNNNDWKNTPNEWIINAFLENIESRFYKNTESKHDFTTSLAMTNNKDSIKEFANTNYPTLKHSRKIFSETKIVKFEKLENIESRFYKNTKSNNLDSKKLEIIESKNIESYCVNLDSKTNEKEQSSDSLTINGDVQSTNLVSPPVAWCEKSEKANAVVHSPLFSQATDKRGTPPFRKKSGCFFLQRGSGAGDMHFFAHCVKEIHTNDMLKNIESRKPDSIESKNILLKNKDSRKIDSIESKDVLSKNSNFRKLDSTESKNVKDSKKLENIESKFYKSIESKKLDSKMQNSQLRDSYQSIPTRPPICKIKMNLLTANFANNVNENIESKNVEFIKNNVDVSLSLNMTKNTESRFYKNTESSNLDSKKAIESNIQDSKKLEIIESNFTQNSQLQDLYKSIPTLPPFCKIKTNLATANFANHVNENIESKNMDSKKIDVDVSHSLNMTKLDSKENIESRFYKSIEIYNLDSKKVIESNLKNSKKIDSKTQNSQLQNLYKSIPTQPPFCKINTNLATANFANHVDKNIESKISKKSKKGEYYGSKL